jgi:hypothetical protein
MPCWVRHLMSTDETKPILAMSELSWCCSTYDQRPKALGGISAPSPTTRLSKIALQKVAVSGRGSWHTPCHQLRPAPPRSTAPHLENDVLPRVLDADSVLERLPSPPGVCRTPQLVLLREGQKCGASVGSSECASPAVGRNPVKRQEPYPPPLSCWLCLRGVFAGCVAAKSHAWTLWAPSDCAAEQQEPLACHRSRQDEEVPRSPSLQLRGDHAW